MADRSWIDTQDKGILYSEAKAYGADDFILSDYDRVVAFIRIKEKLQGLANTSQEQTNRIQQLTQKRESLFFHATGVTNINALIAEIDGCEFPDEISDIVRNYKTIRNRRDNGGYAEPPNASSAHSTRTGIIDISDFRRNSTESIPNARKIIMYVWNIDSDALKNYLCQSLFQNNTDEMDQFISHQIELLNKLRIFFHQYNEIRNVDELLYFQPIFATFLQGFSDSLSNDKFNVINANRIVLQMNLNAEIRLQGFSDLAFIEADGSHITDEFISLLELKAPFKKLHESASYAEKEQLLGEVLCLTDMTEIANINSRYGTYNEVSIGGLTDLFSINILLQKKSSKECFMSHAVCSPELYILYLLILLMRISEDEMESLVKTSRTQPVKVTEDENDDSFIVYNDILSNSNAAKQNRPNQNVKKSGGQSNNAKKVTICFSDSEADKYKEKLESLDDLRVKRAPLGVLTSSELKSMRNNYTYKRFDVNADK